MTFLPRRWTRRAFLATAAHTGLAVPMASALPSAYARRRVAHALVGIDPTQPGQLADPGIVRALAERAVEAARSMGATYADVRLTRTISESYHSIYAWQGNEFFTGRYRSYAPLGTGLVVGPHSDPVDTDTEVYGVGIRVLVNGCWGFAASPIWTVEEMPTLAAEATRQAKANAKATPKTIDLAPARAVSGTWKPSYVIDPFGISPEEKAEHLRAVVDYARQKRGPRIQYAEYAPSLDYEMTFNRQEWALATTDGTYCTQQRFTSGGRMDVQMGWGIERQGMGMRSNLTYTSGSVVAGFSAEGWERMDTATLHSKIDAALELPAGAGNGGDPDPVPVTVGRYTAVCSAEIAADLVARILGPATQLDRALGYEANAGSTSFLTDPLGMLGTLQLGTPEFSVTANRSTPRGMATVKWDDEGIEPNDIALVTDGILTDFQTTRETAMHLAPYYAKRGQAVRSHGCAGAPDALYFPLNHAPNLVMRPGKSEASFDDLIKDVPKGIAFTTGTLDVDFQGTSGVIRSPNSPNARLMAHEIVNGKLGRPLKNAGIAFNTRKLWNSLIAIGGPSSMASQGIAYKKGQPEQTTYSTVSAVPFTLKDAAIIDWNHR